MSSRISRSHRIRTPLLSTTKVAAHFALIHTSNASHSNPQPRNSSSAVTPPSLTPSMRNCHLLMQVILLSTCTVHEIRKIHASRKWHTGRNFYRTTSGEAIGDASDRPFTCGLFHALSPIYALFFGYLRRFVFSNFEMKQTILHQLTHIPYDGLLDGPNLIRTGVSISYRRGRLESSQNYRVCVVRALFGLVHVNI